MTGVWLASIDQTNTVYNDAEIEHTPYSDWSTCTVLYTRAQIDAPYRLEAHYSTLANLLIYGECAVEGRTDTYVFAAINRSLLAAVA